jgi:isopentenyl phosphate kinase
MKKPELIFLKLGGSLITDKSKLHTVRLQVLQRLTKEIAQAVNANPDLKVILGHGSGSFGHVPAKKHHTVEGLFTPEDKAGFLEVQREAHELHDIFMRESSAAGLRVLSFPPSACVVSQDRRILKWDIEAIRKALQLGMIPVVYGDATLDTKLNGTILSTEVLFSYLGEKLRPARILLAGVDEGVYSDYPNNVQLIPVMTPDSFTRIGNRVTSSQHTDVTGGMESKVKIMIDMVKAHPKLLVSIFNGQIKDNVFKGICGNLPGTTIRSRE